MVFVIIAIMNFVVVALALFVLKPLRTSRWRRAECCLVPCQTDSEGAGQFSAMQKDRLRRKRISAVAKRIGEEI